MKSEFLPDTPYADMDGGTIRASADALWILAVCGKLARIWMDDLDEILSDDEPVKAAVPWKNCWNQNGAATEVSWSCSLCVPSELFDSKFHVCPQAHGKLPVGKLPEDYVWRALCVRSREAISPKLPAHTQQWRMPQRKHKCSQRV